MFQKETFSVKGENFGVNSRSVSVCFPATFTALSCVFLLGKNFLVWNLIKFKKQKYQTFLGLFYFYKVKYQSRTVLSLTQMQWEAQKYYKVCEMVEIFISQNSAKD